MQSTVRYPIIDADKAVFIAKIIETSNKILKAIFVFTNRIFQYKCKMTCYLESDKSVAVIGDEKKLIRISFEVVQWRVSVALSICSTSFLSSSEL